MRIAIAVAATILVVGGTSATAATLITSANIKDNTIRGKDVRNGSLGVKDLSRTARAALRGPRGFRGLQGIQGVPGAPGPRGTSDITYVSSPSVPVPPGEDREAVATCPPGTEPTGGAWFEGFIAFVVFTVIDGQSYIVRAHNPDSSATGTVAAQVACAVK